MAVQTYWDLSERERAELTREELERFCDAELMTKGVLRVGPMPKLEAEPAMPTGSLRVWRVRARDVRYGYGRTDLGSICFSTHAQAVAFVALGPMSMSSDYMGGSLTLESAKPAEDVEIYEATVLSEQELERARSLAKTSVAIREANERAKKDHAAAVKARDEALASMFADWSECRARADRLRHVLTTWREYVATCGGDKAIASTFLHKVFPANDVEASREWFASEWSAPVAPVAPAASTMPAANDAEVAHAF